MHTHFKKNVKVYVKLKDGTSFVAMWHKAIRKCFHFMNRQPIRIDKVRFVSFNKPRTSGP